VTFTIDPFVLITPVGDDLTFSTADFSDYVATPTAFIVGTNAPSGADVTVQMDQLVGPGGAPFGGSQISLACDPNPSVAKSGAARATLGLTRCTFHASQGEKKYYIA
jgi:hypothetical protein